MPNVVLIPENQADILLHTLGIRVTDDGITESYRNHFVTGEGHHDLAAVRKLTSLGLMEPRRIPAFLHSADHLYAVTEAGRAVALAEAQKRLSRRPRLTRSQKRYRRWLSLRDVIPDLTFIEFCKHEKDFQ